MRVNFSLHNDCKANKAALSSRQLIWSEVSSAVHIPPVVVPRHSTPHLIFEASDYNNIRLTQDFEQGMEIYPLYWSTIEGPPEQSQALS